MAVTFVALSAVYVVFLRWTQIDAPDHRLPELPPVRVDGPVTRSGSSFLARRGRVWVLGLEGQPIRIGLDHGRLLSPLMAQGDEVMQALYARYVPSRLARGLIDTLVRAKNRNLAESFPEARRAEIFGESRGYRDRFADWMPTFQRLVYLHGLYDISLAFEQSPLLACTSFFATGEATRDGHTWVGRNFDFDVDPWFDREKVVQLVRVAGSVPYVSVAWPGMTGVVTGMNAEGVWVAVHGARGGEREGEGTPVVFTTRAILEQARTLDEAVAIAIRDRPMVPHMLVIADGDDGRAAVVERAPGVETAVVWGDGATLGISNHYRSPGLRGDPRNRAVRDTTSTVARGTRMDELLRVHRGRIDATVGVAMLRDRRASETTDRPLGHRAAIDGLLAAHGVVADLTARVLWVSESPHLLGRFVRFDVGALRTSEGLARSATAPDEGAIAADPMTSDGRYARFLLGARWRREAESLRAVGDLDGAVEMIERALALRDDDHEA
ncbi:MAG: hypothetical protein IT379_04770, partial [Deltaproteobacteria bacterium]|nr:hypothetical protein [Deltaproteobacteria bacterium]